MRILGISSMFHDAAVSVIEDGEILFASHSERYSRVKNDPFLNKEIIEKALSYGLPDAIVFHEDSMLKKKRQLKTLNWHAIKAAFTEPTQEEWVKRFYPQLKGIPTFNYLHHESHAAAGALTSPYDECAVMTIDAIGENQTATIYKFERDKGFTLLSEVLFPNSLGLFYSAATARCGLKPMEDEYILMGMAAYGKELYVDDIKEQLFKPMDYPHQAFATKVNLQRGLPKDFLPNADDFDLAASVQRVTEERIMAYAKYARELTGINNLVFMGGCALNCVANSLLYKYFDNIWIMPNPGDAGSSLGAAAMHWYKQTGKKVNWVSPYLGEEIPGKWPERYVLQSLLKREVFGVASGKAEFGPRALGNRSLMADPRGQEMKDRVNAIKQRQKFRPFAPIVLEEYARDWFDFPAPGISYPYMQFVAKCKRPDEVPAIVHADGTSRVQTVNEKLHPELYRTMKKFFEHTKCPIVLNTSLNIKGQPIVNTVSDAEAFSRMYGVPVYTDDK